MKKNYSKPDILFESFMLNTNIAAGCEEKPDTQGDGCGKQVGRSIIFTDGINDNCNSHITEGKNEFNNICYHNPFETYNLFFS